MYPAAELLLSTIAPKTEDYGRLIALSKRIDKVGLQFSIHQATDHERNRLIPYRNKLSLNEIRDFGILWWKETGRHPYLNYCIDGYNNTIFDADNLMDRFSPVVFNFTFSVICSKNETMKNAGYKNLDAIRTFEEEFIEAGYNTRIFNPDGQDDIGGGCGQLWYVQQWMKEHKEQNK
jgi:23S rRNA (adenine2503-C2)-methyltransferase